MCVRDGGVGADAARPPGTSLPLEGQAAERLLPPTLPKRQEKWELRAFYKTGRRAASSRGLLGKLKLDNMSQKVWHAEAILTVHPFIIHHCISQKALNKENKR